MDVETSHVFHAHAQFPGLDPQLNLAHPESLTTRALPNRQALTPGPPRRGTLMPPTERSPAELTLVRAVEDLLTVAPIELALTETMGVLL
jgi:hypothetical protein